MKSYLVKLTKPLEPHCLFYDLGLRNVLLQPKIRTEARTRENKGKEEKKAIKNKQTKKK